MQQSDPKPAHDAESLLVHFRRLEELKEQVLDFPSVALNPWQLCDLEMLLNRAYYPLDGYMGRGEYESVLQTMRLPDGSRWPLPVCLGVSAAQAQGLEKGTRVALRDGEGFMLAVLTVSDVWKPDLKAEAVALHGETLSGGLPNVSCCHASDVRYVGGRVEGLSLPQHYDFKELRRSPADIGRLFSQRGWRRVVGVQAGRPLHRADRAMLDEIARDENACILLSPLMFPSMYSSVDHFMLVRCLREFVETFSGRAMLNIMPWFERRMGPRGALLRAAVNRNYGCTHMLVWDTGKAEPRLNSLTDEFQAHVDWLGKELAGSGIVPVRERCMALDEATGEYGSSRNGTLCANDHNAVVDCLNQGREVPAWMSFPGVVDALAKTCKPRSKKGFTLFFTGLSGAEKSTLAKILYVKLLELNNRPVTLLDGDIVRSNLSSELDFSRAHRNLNVTRIGFVASEIVKNGGVAVCAPIAPYPESRRQVRETVQGYGGFIEVHVSTPLQVCEMRDRKGIYAKARAGLVKGLTGIDDPYLEPENPELRVDTTDMTPEEAAGKVMKFLVDSKYI